jgi:hypothetical protein
MSNEIANHEMAWNYVTVRHITYLYIAASPALQAPDVAVRALRTLDVDVRALHAAYGNVPQTAAVVIHAAARSISPSGQSYFLARADVSDVASVDVSTNCNITAAAVDGGGEPGVGNGGGASHHYFGDGTRTMFPSSINSSRSFSWTLCRQFSHTDSNLGIFALG